MFIAVFSGVVAAVFFLGVVSNAAQTAQQRRWAAWEAKQRRLLRKQPRVYPGLGH